MNAPRPRTLALIDGIVTVLRDGPGTPDEIAVRVGTVACGCQAAGRPGMEADGAYCYCTRVGSPGWRPTMRHDVYRLLVQLRNRGMVARVPDPNGSRADAWSLVQAHGADGLEEVWALPTRETR